MPRRTYHSYTKKDYQLGGTAEGVEAGGKEWCLACSGSGELSIMNLGVVKVAALFNINIAK